MNCEELRHDLAKFLAQTSPGHGLHAGGEVSLRALRRGHRRRAGGARAADRQGAGVVLQQQQERRPAAAAGDREDPGDRQRQRQGRLGLRSERRRQVRAPAARDGALDSHPGRAAARQAADHPGPGAVRQLAPRGLEFCGLQLRRLELRRYELRFGGGDRDRRPLLRAAPHRRGGDGARVRGRAHRHRPARRAQDLAPGLQPDARPGRAAAARGARRLEDLAPQRRRRHRFGDHPGRRLLLRDGVPRGDRARRAHLPRGEAGRRARPAHRRADLRAPSRRRTR